MELPDYSARRRILRYRDLPDHVREHVDLMAAKAGWASELVEKLKALPIYEFLVREGFTHVHVTPSRNLMFEQKNRGVQARPFLPKSKMRPVLRIPLR